MKIIESIKAEYLYHHPQNPRKDLGDLSELTESIRKNGIMQNLTVVPDAKRALDEGHPAYLVVIGNRRMEAGKAAGLTEFPCVISEMGEREQVSTMLEENMQRADLTYYEQAQGFQLMMDLGDTVEGIASKTGFSRKTVKQRLEMAKLDKKKLKDACSKQISLADLDELTKIHDVKLRNQAMERLGQNDFAYTVQKLARKEKVDVELPFVQKKLKELNAKKIGWSETYGGKYDRYCEMKITEAVNKPDKDWIYRPGEKVFYHLEEERDQLMLYHENERAKAKKKTQKDIDRERYIEDSWLKLLQMAADFHELRKKFIFEQRLTAKNTDLILNAAVDRILNLHFSYAMTTPFFYLKDDVKETKSDGTKKWCSSEETCERILALLKKKRADLIPRLVWESMGDVPTITCTGYIGRKSFPEYVPHGGLEMIYRYLTSLGYEPCEEEGQMLNGTHPVYKDRDAKEA